MSRLVRILRFLNTAGASLLRKQQKASTNE